jgi:hypothetical protein
MGYASLLASRRRNLLNYSEELDNAVWATSNATIAANAATGPFGGLNADTFTATAQFGNVQQVASRDVGWYTVSAWMRIAAGTRTIALGFQNLGGYVRRVDCTVTTTWTRFTYTGLHNDTSFTIGAMIADRNAAGFTAIEVFGLQMERGETATAYQKTITDLAG